MYILDLVRAGGNQGGQAASVDVARVERVQRGCLRRLFGSIVTGWDATVLLTVLPLFDGMVSAYLYTPVPLYVSSSMPDTSLTELG